MVNKQNRKIGKSTVKDMLSWAHYEFQQRLIFKSQRRNGANKVILVGEEQTTMTCGQCGLMNRNVGGSKTFICNDKVNCGYVAGRDENAARNILLKNY